MSAPDPAAPPPGLHATGSLRGLKVIDLSRILAGPLCAQMLGDHGADVIKVEPPMGDDTRHWGPPFLADQTSAYYQALHRNKQNIVADLASEPGRDLLRLLLADADVLIENFKAGTLGRWGFSDDDLTRDFPRLIHVRITGVGVDGPRGGRPGYDAAIQAEAGLMSGNGETGGAPLRVGVPIVDMVTGLNAFAGTLLALHERTRSGLGQLVDTTLLDTCVSLLHPHSANWFATHEEPVLTGSAHPTVAPYDAFPTADGTFFIAVGNDAQFAKLMGVLGQPEIAKAAGYATNAARAQNREALRALLIELLRDWTRADLSAALERVGVPGSPVSTVGEALRDPQVRHRQMVIERDGYEATGIPIKLSRTPGAFRFPPRAMNQDAEEVMSALRSRPPAGQTVAAAVQESSRRSPGLPSPTLNRNGDQN
jgi:crotonobetainyl-CoA:carnitine CoA-transferase CaiB-like acyl-CoA transferase